MTDAEIRTIKTMLAAKRCELMHEVHGGAVRLSVNEGEADPIDRMRQRNYRLTGAAGTSGSEPPKLWV